jgi:hypothetical protein
MAQSTGTRIVSVTADDTTYIVAAQWGVPTNTMIEPTSVTLATDLFTLAGHGFSNGDIVVPQSLGTVTGTGLAINQPLFIVSVATDTFKVSLTFGGTAIDLGGAATTPCTFSKRQAYSLARVSGFLSVTTSGTYVVLPEAHFDTDTATEAIMGPRKVYIAAGAPYPCLVKKVFSTGSATTTGIYCIFN